MLSKVYCGKTWEPNYCLFARLGVGWRRGYRRWAPALKKKEDKETRADVSPLSQISVLLGH